MNEFKSIELFTGAGGLALGLEKTGWKHLELVERDKNACSTIRLNQQRKHPLVIHWRLRSTDVKRFEYAHLPGEIDLVAGGPPCQPFSLGGKHGANQDRRDMFPEAVRAVRTLKPKYFIFENVKGLLRQSFANYFNYIILQFTYPSIHRKENETWYSHLSRLERVHTSGINLEYSYNVIYRLLDAADYGVPQRRHRVFIVGFRSDLGNAWSFPQATHNYDKLLWDQWVTGSYWEEHKIPKKQRPAAPVRLRTRIERLKADYGFLNPPGKRWKTVRDGLKGIPDPRSNNSLLNHEFKGGARPYKGHTGSTLDEPSKALKAGDHGVPGGENMMAFPDHTYRYYTVRESARIQTFPDDYVFSGSWTEAMRQIGNAVPVRLAEAVGDSIRVQSEN